MIVIVIVIVIVLALVLVSSTSLDDIDSSNCLLAWLHSLPASTTTDQQGTPF
jgi:hypothetical protein